jgi:hypothetical protein
MKAIQTKFMGPTDFKGARVKAWIEGIPLVMPWNHGLEAVDNHGAAARALAVSLKWSGRLVGGSLPDPDGESMAWVFVDGGVSVEVRSC